MEQRNTRLRNAGFVTFFFSGICTISSGVVVSLLQEEYGFAYGMTGTLLSLLSIGNLLAGLLAQTCENLLEQGITPDVYYNGHLAYERDDVKEHNDALVDKYYRRMRNL